MLAWFLKKTRGKNAFSLVLFAFLLLALVPALAFALEPGEKCTGASRLLPSCWLEEVLNVLGGILNLFINPLAGVVKAISNTLASVMVTTIKYVLSVPVNPGHPLAPAFLKEIWGFSRALTNSFFVLLLAIIGLATILRMQNYQWQKTLPSLFIAVLLVNFSGVFVGLVVDFSNIISNAFISSVSNDTNWSVQSEFAFTGKGVQELAFHVGEIIFYAFIAFVYLATLVLFVLRTIILWIIAALAPIAFGLYVLPATNSYWQQWFKALIQWSVMGIPISFAIFFASAALTLTGQSIGSGDKPAFFAQAAGPFTAVVILIMGVGMALAGAPAVSQGVMKLGRKWGLAAAKAGGLAGSAALWRKFGGKITKPGEKLSAAGERIQGWGTRQRGLGRVAGISAMVAGWGVKKGGVLTTYGGQEATKRLHLRDYQEFQDAVAETKKVGNSDDVLNMIRQETEKGPLRNKNRLLGLLTGMRSRGDADDIENALFKKGGILEGQKHIIGEAIKTGSRVGPDGIRPLFKAFYGRIMADPRAFGFDADAEIQRDEKGRFKNVVFKNGKDVDMLEANKTKIPERMTAADFEGNTSAPSNYDTDTVAGEIFIKTMLKQRGAEFIGPIIRRREREDRLKIARFMGSIPKDWFLDNEAEDVLRWFTSTAARSLGVGMGLTSKEVDDMIEAHRALGRKKEDLREERNNLARRLEETTTTKTRNLLEQRIQDLDNVLSVIDLSPEELTNTIGTMEREIQDFDQRIQAAKSDGAKKGLYAERAKIVKRMRVAERAAQRSTPPTVEEASRTRLQAAVSQLNARAQELQNFIQQAHGPAGVVDSTYQQQLPIWEAELARTHKQITDAERQLRKIEGLKVPKAPAALPEIQSDMPSQLQGTIKRGNAVAQTIKNMTQEMQKSLGGISNSQTDFNEVLGEMENVQRQVAELNQQEQLGALGPDLKAKRDELLGNLQDLAQSRRDLRQEIAQQTETAIRTKEAIDARKADLEGIRKEITPLQEEYEGVKTREARETRIKQRRKRKS